MEHIVNVWLFVLTIVSGAIGWFLRTLWDMTQSLQRDVTMLEVRMAKDYVPNTRISELTTAIFERFDRLEDKFERCFIRNHHYPPGDNNGSR